MHKCATNNSFKFYKNMQNISAKIIFYVFTEFSQPQCKRQPCKYLFSNFLFQIPQESPNSPPQNASDSDVDAQVYVDIANAENPMSAWNLNQFRTASVKGLSMANLPLAEDFLEEEESDPDELPPLVTGEPSAMEDVD